MEQETYKVNVRMTDLWADPEGGYSENASWVKTATIEIPRGTSDRTLARRILASVGATGMRRDGWCSASCGCWRSGCIGVYADWAD